MAVSLSSVEMYQEKVEEKINLWEPLQSTDFNSRKQRVKQLISQLYEKEKLMLESIAPGLTIEELRNNILKYHENGFHLLSNKDASRIVQLYRKNVGQNNLIALDAFEKWLQSDDFRKPFESFLEDKLSYGKALEKTILKIVNENLQPGEGRIQTHSRLAKKFEQGFLPIDLLNTLGKETQKRILRRINVEDSPKINISEVTDSSSISFKLPTGQLEGTTYIDWWNLTGGKKESEIKEDIIKGTVDLETLKNKLIEVITSYILQKETLLSNKIVNKIVENVITRNPYCVFVGKNEKHITGILGEIQALCYIALLCGDKFSLNSKIIDWSATQLDEGGQYHADIILETIYGIQVKNTTKDIVDEIPFNKAALPYILENMVDENYLSQQESDIIKDVYTTYYFNIPYVLDGKQLVAGSNLEYQPTEDKLISYVTLADKLLTHLFDYFMYIGVGDVSKNERGNLLFILGGKHAVLASEICLAILDVIDSLSGFKIDRPEQGTSSIENIVTFTNNNKLLMTKNNQSFVSGAAMKVSAFLHEAISSKILLQSSYDFTSILNKIYN